MRFTISIVLMTALAALAEHHGGVVPAGGGGGRTSGGPSGGFHGSFMGHSTPAPSGHVAHMRSVPVSRPAPIVNQQHFVHDNRQIAFPRHDEGGRPITRPPARFPPAHHADVVRNRAVIRDIGAIQRTELVQNRFFWHNVNGVRFCHFFDPFGVHWFGFYVGPSFYWCRWWGARWWWWDPVFFRWVYWNDGYWWWQGGDGLVYAYVDNNYYPYDQVVGGVTTVESRPQQPSSTTPPNAGAGQAYYSPDGRRMIQIYGDRAEAFLYDITGDPPKFLKYVAANVSSARFTGGTRGKALSFLLDFKDGTFAVFDENGRSLTGTPEPAQPVKAIPAPQTTEQTPHPESPEQPPPNPEPGEVPGNPAPPNQ